MIMRKIRVAWILATAVGASFFIKPAFGGEPFILGVQTHFAQMKMNTPEGRAMAGQLGVDFFRDGFYWSEVEKTRGVYLLPQRAEQFLGSTELNTLRPLLVLYTSNGLYSNDKKPIDPAAVEGFAKFSKWVAKEFQSRSPILEIWNEWDLKIEPRDPASYLRLVKEVHNAVKPEFPSVKLLAGATTPDALNNGWVDDFIRQGGLRFCDGLSIHPYNYSRRTPKNMPENIYDWLEGRYQAWKRLNGGKEFDIYLSEIGWPLVPKLELSDKDIAAYTLRMAALMRGLPFVKGMSWYDLFDDGTDPTNKEHRFGLATYDGVPRAGYYGLREAAWVPKADGFRLIVPNGTLLGVYAAMGRVGGETVMMVWDTRKGSTKSLIRMPQEDTAEVSRFSKEGPDLFVRKNVKGFWSYLSDQPIILRGLFDPSRVVLLDGERVIKMSNTFPFSKPRVIKMDKGEL